MKATTVYILLVIFLYVGVFIFVNSQKNLNNHPTLNVDIPGQGWVLGKEDRTSWSNQTFMQFLGIPYAESPKGNLRFKAPKAKLPWNDVLNATNYGRRCPVITSVTEMSREELKQDLENCLNLCVYTKNLTKIQPVMFYIYGGGFYNGSASDHPPRYLLEKDIVLVVPNYRIGALGWLSTLSEDMPGNAPVNDLLLALEWVKYHIGVFGGDPESVTIFGQSAGAAMTGALLLSPRTPHGVFKRAIMQSGSILAGWALKSKPLEQTQRICKKLNCENCDVTNKLHRCLREATVVDLLQATTNESFSPIVGDLHGVLPQQPMELLKLYSRPIHIMTGFTKNDGSFVLASYYDALKLEVGNMSHLTVRKFAEGMMTVDPTGLTNNLLSRMLFRPEILDSNEHKKAIPGYFDLTSIETMKSPVIAFGSKIMQKRIANVYLYSFDYDGKNSRFGYEFGNDHYPFNGGIHHSNDNIYLFSTHELNENDTKIAKEMVSLWTSFAFSGVPKTDDGQVITSMENESGPFFRIDKDVTIDYDVLQELTAAIDDPDKFKLDRKNVEF